jgi:hypothetical protein
MREEGSEEGPVLIRLGARFSESSFPLTESNFQMLSEFIARILGWLPSPLKPFLINFRIMAPPDTEAALETSLRFHSRSESFRRIIDSAHTPLPEFNNNTSKNGPANF